jgi:hypothetical protein
VESIKFSNGVIWTEAQLWNAYLTQAAATNDALEGTDVANTIRGGLGNDYLNGRDGADTYLFNRGDGQDTLYDDSNDSVNWRDRTATAPIIFYRSYFRIARKMHL